MSAAVQKPPILTDTDLKRLDRFRIPDDVMVLHEVRHVTSMQARLECGIYFGGDTADLSGIVYPIWGADGTIKGYRVRRDNFGDGEPKYVQSKDPSHLNFERTSRQYLLDISAPVVFVEAALSALAIAAWCQRIGEKYLVIATHGCWGWRATTGITENANGERVSEKGPSPDLDHIAFAGRKVIICADSNIESNSDVQNAARAFKKELQKRGATVLIARTPSESGVNGPVNGPDDWIALHTDDEFLEFLDTEADVESENRWSGDKNSKESQADRLIALARDMEFFHVDHDLPFVSARVGNHTETWSVKSNGFRRWLSRAFWNEYKKVPSSQAIQDALNVLAGRAIHDGKQILVHTRVAEHDGNLYLDLANTEWSAVKIAPTGWSIVNDVPVKFIRPRGMLEIPPPCPGGHLDELRQFLNIAGDDDFALVKAFTIATLRPDLPFPFLALTGEQGSGKTNFSNTLKLLVDPGKAAVRGLPRDPRDLAIAAANGWLLAFDNVSAIPAWTSDALCSLSTGGGFSTRELYSDSDEKIFDYQRPMILNGIGDIVTRPDLLDRCIILQLPIIPENKRRQESDLNRLYAGARPRILGALLDAAAIALRRQSSVKLERLPRMADFAVWGVAAESAHSDKSVFLAAYVVNRASLNQVAIDTSTIGPALLQLMNSETRWEGLLAELLEALNAKVSEAVRKSKAWPSIPRQLKSELVRLAPNLRQIGIDVHFGKRTNKGILIGLEHRGQSSSLSTPSSQQFTINTVAGDDDGVDGGGRRHSSSLSDSANPFEFDESADGDDSDDTLGTPSTKEEERV